MNVKTTNQYFSPLPPRPRVSVVDIESVRAAGRSGIQRVLLFTIPFKTGPEAHTASSVMGTRNLLQEQSDRTVQLATQSHLVTRLGTVQRYLLWHLTG
jgi:hypothetical protein